MPAPKDIEKRKLWRQKLTTSKLKKKYCILNKCECGCGNYVREGYKYRRGHNQSVAWNKGLTSENDERVKRISENRKGPRPSINGENNPFYGMKHKKETLQKISEKNFKGGCSDWWAIELKKTYSECCLCKSKNNLNMHHINEDRKNNEKKNLIIICRICHSFWHFN